MHLDIIDMIIANVYNHHIGIIVPYHKYLHRCCTYSTCARICSLTSLARKRTAFYAYSERQHESYAKLTALNRSIDGLPNHCTSPTLRRAVPDNVQPHTSRP